MSERKTVEVDREDLEKLVNLCRACWRVSDLYVTLPRPSRREFVEADAARDRALFETAGVLGNVAPLLVEGSRVDG